MNPQHPSNFAELLIEVGQAALATRGVVEFSTGEEEMSANEVASLGLILDIAGVCILFKWGFPQPKLEKGNALLMEEDDEEAVSRRKVWVVMSSIALACLVVGFGLQLWAIWM